MIAARRIAQIDGQFNQIPGVRATLKIGARQVVEQHFKTSVEEIFPPPSQMREEFPLEVQHQIVNVVEFVNLGQLLTGSQQISQGAVFKPVPIELPFAARFSEPIHRQNQQDPIPAGSLHYSQF
jgi:hypothetical protein